MMGVNRTGFPPRYNFHTILRYCLDPEDSFHNIRTFTNKSIYLLNVIYCEVPKEVAVESDARKMDRQSRILWIVARLATDEKNRRDRYC